MFRLFRPIGLEADCHKSRAGNLLGKLQSHRQVCRGAEDAFCFFGTGAVACPDAETRPREN